MNRFALPDDTLGQALLHFDQLLTFAFKHARDRNAGPGRHDFGDVFLGDLLAEKPFARRLLLHGFFRRRQLALQLWNGSVLNLRSGVQISGTLGFLQLCLGLLELAVEVADGVDGRLFVLPLSLQPGGRFFQIGQRFLDLFQALTRSFVLFLFQRALLDLELHDLAFKLIDLRRHGIQLHAQTRSGFIHQVHRLVGQKTVGDVAMRESRGGDQRSVLDADAVMNFVTLLQPAQDRNGGFDRRLFHEDGLEPSFQRGVLFDVLAILIERGRADTPKFTARELRLEHVRGVSRAFSFAGAHDGMEFVNEENDASFAGGDLFEKGFQPLLKLAAVFGAGDHGAKVHGHELLVLERLRNVTADDPASQAFGDGGLAHAWFANKDRVVFRAAAEDLHHPTDFLIAADDRINFASARQSGKIAAIFFQSLEFILRILVSNTLVAAQFSQRLEDGVVLETTSLKNLFKRGAAMR